MCSISGCIIFDKARSENQLSAIEQKLRSLITCGEDRGRDSYGVVSFQTNGKVVEIKSLGKPSDSLKSHQRFVFSDTRIVMNNDRAEPTTEYVPKKKAEDIQPFGYRLYVTHNGIIANDHELEQKYNLMRSSKIDSAILPPLLEKLWNRSLDDLQHILRDEILGSFALAVVDKLNPTRLFLACNYKPIFTEYDPQLDVLFFTSLESYLGQLNKPLWESNPVRQMEPYSILSIDTKKKTESLTLWKQDAKTERRALVVCSAGLDSTVAAKLMIDQGYEVTLLHFKYKHRAEKREEECVKRIAETLKVELKIVDTDLFKNVIKHSRLTETFEPIEKDRAGEAGAEFAHEWVPARNLIFLSIATGIAEANGFGRVVLGNNLEEAGAYPDNEMIFVNKLNAALPYATNLQKRVSIDMPVGNLMKHEIVKLGLQIGAPLHLTWSCYEGGEKHCGKCGPCYMRRKGFEINNSKDPAQIDAFSETVV
ncbi:MAG TPA: 7-cyano-7-deazaguanine synthase QueC [Candidatus Bathyarchaeia archaeon]|nr:7-cyano-7-deazaguanine synthase QueC [Candidatus Bathyarchaeia archaeon]